MYLEWPYLDGIVELTDERMRHIAERHPDLLPAYREQLAETLIDPDEVRWSVRFGQARLFSKWFEDVLRGKYIVVVVVSDPEPHGRHWVITAYITRQITVGETEWKRS